MLVTVVTGASRLSGFLREAVIAGVFGASVEVDAYLIAYQVPNVLIALVSTAVVTATVPLISARVRNGETYQGHQLFRTVVVVVTAVLGVASIVVALAAPAMVRLLAPGFGTAPARLAADLTRVLLISTVFVAGMNLVSGLLQVHRRFFWPAFVGVPFNAAMIAAALVLGPVMGVASLAWGFVVGSVLRVLVQLPSLRRTGFRWFGAVRLRDPGMAAISGLLPVILIGHVVSNINVVVDRMVASGLPDGAIASLNYAYRLVGLPHGLLVVALLQVLYPALGAAASQRRTFAWLSTRGMTALLTLLTPVATAMVILALPTVQVVYGRGAFTDAAAIRTAAALAAFAPGLVALGVRDLAMRSLYGLQDRWRPAAIACVGLGVNVVGDLVLGPRFGVIGLGAATTLSFAASAVMAIAMLARSHHGVVVRDLVAAVARNVVAVVPTAVVIRVLMGVLPTPASTGVVFTVAVSAAAGVVIHLVTLRVLRAPELDALLDLVRQLIDRLRSSRRQRSG